VGNIERVIREVDSSMTMEGLPLTKDDKNRIRKCLTDPSALDGVIGNLLAKHTVPLRN